MADFPVQRRRQSDARDAIDRIAEPDPAIGARYKGRVYNGGSMPAAVPRVYLTHPVETSCPESEGAVPTDAVGTGSVPVLVTCGVPAVGDDLLARKVGGLWVARVGRGSRATICRPCDLPLTDLLLTVEYNLQDVNHLTYYMFNDPAWPTGTKQDTLKLHADPIVGLPVAPPFWLSDCTSMPGISLSAEYLDRSPGVPSSYVPVFPFYLFGAESVLIPGPIRPRPRDFRWLLHCGTGGAAIYQVGYQYNQACGSIVPYLSFAPGFSRLNRDISFPVDNFNSRCTPLSLSFLGNHAQGPIFGSQDFYNPVRRLTITRP